MRAINPEIKRQYLEWIMVPPGLREPKTKKELAELLGVSDRSFYNWEASEEFQAELRSIKLKMGARWYADLLGGLYDLAVNGPAPQRVAATKLLLDHLDVSPNEETKEDLAEDVKLAIKKALEEDGWQVVAHDS